MASEIRVNKLNSQTGVGTITLSPTGVDISGITTASTLRATTGIITTLQVGTISGDGSSLTGVASTENIRTNTNATFLQNVNVSGSTTTGSLVSSGAISGTTGTFTSNLNIAANIRHIDDSDTFISFPANNEIELKVADQQAIKFTTTSIETGDNKRIDIIDAGGDRSGEIANSDSGANSLKISADPDNSGSSTVMQFAVDGTERLRIDSSGNIMFGTTSSTVYDDSSGSGVVIRGATGALDVMRNNDHPLLLNRTGGDGQMIMYHRDGTNKAASALRSGHLCFDLPSGTEKIRFQSTGGISFNGDTATANALDDYEEGTWTPNYSYSNGGSPTLSEAIGLYRKIGAYVYCTFTTTNSAQGGGSGEWILNNLPFTSTTTTGSRHHGGITYFTGMASALRSNMVLYNAGNTTSVYIYHQNSSNEQIEQVTRNYIQSNTTIRGWVIFMTN